MRIQSFGEFLKDKLCLFTQIIKGGLELSTSGIEVVQPRHELPESISNAYNQLLNNPDDEYEYKLKERLGLDQETTTSPLSRSSNRDTVHTNDLNIGGTPLFFTEKRWFTPVVPGAPVLLSTNAVPVGNHHPVTTLRPR